MSASKQKKVRTEQRSEGIDKKSAAAAEKALKDRKFKRNTIITVVVVVIVLAAAIIINSNLFYTGLDAVVIDDTAYSAAEVSFYYSAAVNELYSEVYSMSSSYGYDIGSLLYNIDFSSPMEEQACPMAPEDAGEDYTWADYFYDSAVDSLIGVTVLYNEAMDKGYTLTAEDEAAIESAMEQYTYAALSNGLDDDTYFAYMFGKGADTETVRSLVTMQTIADSYGLSVYESFEYGADELQAYYSENKDELDMFTYHTYTVSMNSAAYEALETDEEKKAAARADADAIAEAADIEEYIAAVKELEGEDYEDSTKAVSFGSSLSSNIKEWLTADERKAGDTYVYDSDSSSTVVMFVQRNDNSYKTVNMRHLLIQTVADENGEYTDAARLEAKMAIDELYAQWEADPTEENFIELVKTHSEDTNTESLSAGGIYEDIYRNSMVEEIDEFLFAEGRKAGDTAVVHGSSSYYDGYHIVYFVGENEQLFCDYLADGELRTAEYEEYCAGLVEGVEPVKKLGAKFINY